MQCMVNHCKAFVIHITETDVMGKTLVIIEADKRRSLGLSSSLVG
jgi:hypothetical protein